jgi:transposase
MEGQATGPDRIEGMLEHRFACKDCAQLAASATRSDKALAAAGASLLCLPPYSPDLNPIEQLFAKLKALLRKAAARTKDELWSTIGRLLATVSPAECARYLHHCEYASI